MGNANGTPKPGAKVTAADDEDLPPIPDLIRQSSKSKEEECSICFDQMRKGILCSTKEHFICQNCFAPYVSSIAEDAGKMQDAGFTIKCCYPNCTAEPWTSHEARLALDGNQKVLDQYVDALVQQLQRVNQRAVLPTNDMANDNVDIGLRKIVDALTLGCPFCHVALDPSPDGCAAMRCGSCSKYFCFLCFNIQRDNKDCHEHVRVCPSNPSHNVFPPKAIRDAAQKQLRIAAICSVLSSLYGLHWRQHPHTMVLLEGSQAVLKDSFISPAEVLDGRGSLTLKTNSSLATFMGGFMVAACMAVFWIQMQGVGESSGGVVEHIVSHHNEAVDNGSFMVTLIKMICGGFFSLIASSNLIQIPPVTRLQDHYKGIIVIVGTLAGAWYFSSMKFNISGDESTWYFSVSNLFYFVFSFGVNFLSCCVFCGTIEKNVVELRNLSAGNKGLAIIVFCSLIGVYFRILEVVFLITFQVVVYVCSWVFYSVRLVECILIGALLLWGLNLLPA